MKGQIYQQWGTFKDNNRPNYLLLLLHMMGNTYPVGGFSHSFGLESYICSSKIKGVSDLRDYMVWTIRQNYLCFEGPAFCLAYEAGMRGDAENWQCIDMENTAMRLSGENRLASLKMGRAFWRLSKAVFGEKEFVDCYECVKRNHCLGNYVVAVGYLMGVFQVPLREALQAFIFSGINNLVQAGIKMIPLGQSESQNMLYSLYAQIIEATEELLSESSWEATNFVPMSDVYSMQHEVLYTRLYMS